MNKHLSKRHSFAASLLLIIVFTSGCKTVLRENVISSINTVYGVEVAQNSQSGSYEFKLGFVRSQLHSVPTSKMVEGGTSSPSLSSDPQNTPELVSGIRIGSDGGQSSSVSAKISENFAVGKIAVMSPAAVAMYLGQITNPAVATAAANAVARMSTPLNKLDTNSPIAAYQVMDGVLSFLKALPPRSNPTAIAVANAVDIEVGSFVPDTVDFTEYRIPPAPAPAPDLIIDDSVRTIGATGYIKFKAYRSRLNQSIGVLESKSGTANAINVSSSTAGPVAKISGEQNRKFFADLVSQTQRLKELDKKFSEHKSVVAAWELFLKVASQE